MSKIPSNWFNIGEDLTDAAFERLGIRDIMRFSDEGQIKEYRVMRMSKKKRLCYITPVKTYAVSELEAMASPQETTK